MLKRFLATMGLAMAVSLSAAAQHKSARQGSGFTMMIRQMDKNGDRKVSREEYFASFKDRKAAEANFKKWDYNKDGFLTEADYRLQPLKKK